MEETGITGACNWSMRIIGVTCAMVGSGDRLLIGGIGIAGDVGGLAILVVVCG